MSGWRKFIARPTASRWKVKKFILGVAFASVGAAFWWCRDRALIEASTISVLSRWMILGRDSASKSGLKYCTLNLVLEGDRCRERGDLAAALYAYEKALRESESDHLAAQGSGHGHILMRIAQTSEDLGLFSVAVDRYLDVLRLASSSGGSVSYSIVEPSLGLAACYQALQKQEEQQTKLLLMKVLEVATNATDAPSENHRQLSLASACRQLASLCRDQETYADAMLWTSRALHHLDHVNENSEGSRIDNELITTISELLFDLDASCHDCKRIKSVLYYFKKSFKQRAEQLEPSVAVTSLANSALIVVAPSGHHCFASDQGEQHSATIRLKEAQKIAKRYSISIPSWPI